MTYPEPQHGPGHPMPPGQPPQPPHGGPWPYPPAKRSPVPIILAVVITAVVIVGGLGGYWLITRGGGSDGAKSGGGAATTSHPPVDDSKDLPNAPADCSVITAAELAPYIGGRIDFEPAEHTPLDDAASPSHHPQELGGCEASNLDTHREDGVSSASVVISTELLLASREKSGTDAMGENFADTEGEPVPIPDADDARFDYGKGGNDATLDIRYRNYRVQVYYISGLHDPAPEHLRTAAIGIGTAVMAKITAD